MRRGSRCIRRGGTRRASSSVPPVSGYYSTSFTGTENPISEGGVWKHTSNIFTYIQTNGDLAYGTQTGTGGTGGTGYDDSYAYIDPAQVGFTANQSCQGVVYRSPTIDTSCSHEVELLLRWSDDGTHAWGYECLLAHDGGMGIVRWNGLYGDFTILSTTGSGPVEGSTVTGDTFRAQIIGSTIKVFRNDIEIYQAIDSTYPSGQPGVGAFRRNCGSVSDHAFSSWSATNI